MEGRGAGDLPEVVKLGVGRYFSSLIIVKKEQ